MTNNPPRFAAIDFGTNSVRLLIADIYHSQDKTVKIVPVCTIAHVVQLGKRIHDTKLICPENITKCIAALENFSIQIQAYQPQKMFAVATSVFRDALNAPEVITTLEQYIHCPITVVSGAEEAELMYLGIMVNRGSLSSHTNVCIDIGGGSTEFIAAQGKHIMFNESYPLGCLRSKNVHIHNDPPLDLEINQLKENIELTISSLREKIPPAIHCFCFGGTLTTLAMIIHSTVNVVETENKILSADTLLSFMESIRSLTDREIGIRFAQYMDKGRESVLRTGTYILLFIMQYLNIIEVTVTNQGILYGTLHKKFDSIQQTGNCI
ncbi:MAG: hypothetical protein AB1454_10500 [Candidatus Auribacterota bacterium]